MTPTIRKTMGGALAAVTLAGSLVAFAPDASAQYRRHHHRHNNGGAVAAGVVGGLALGALAAGAANSGGYYGQGYAAPVYGSECRVYVRRVWDGYGWVRERVREC